MTPWWLALITQRLVRLADGTVLVVVKSVKELLAHVNRQVAA